MNDFCYTCNNEGHYIEEFDVYYCKKCDHWLEETCEDLLCLRCAQRDGKRPSEVLSEKHTYELSLTLNVNIEEKEAFDELMIQLIEDIDLEVIRYYIYQLKETEE